MGFNANSSPNQLTTVYDRDMTQMLLKFPAARTWGGRRARAGRKCSERPSVPHRSREDFPGRFPAHVTLKVRSGLPSLRSVRLVRELERSFREASERGTFRLAHYSIQHDHVHLIVEASDRHTLGRGMQSLGARLARAVNRIFDRSGPVLRERYHLQLLTSPRQVRSAIAYVLLNAQKHARQAWRGVGRIDRASSARWFDGFRDPVASPPDAPAVAPARSWLLRTGWRRWGLISLAEVPGPGKSRDHLDRSRLRRGDTRPYRPRE